MVAKKATGQLLFLVKLCTIYHHSPSTSSCSLSDHFGAAVKAAQCRDGGKLHCNFLPLALDSTDSRLIRVTNGHAALVRPRALFGKQPSFLEAISGWVGLDEALSQHSSYWSASRQAQLLASSKPASREASLDSFLGTASLEGFSMVSEAGCGQCVLRLGQTAQTWLIGVCKESIVLR